MSEWRPFEVSRDDHDQAFRNAIAAVFDDVNDQQMRRDQMRRLVSLLMHIAVIRAVDAIMGDLGFRPALRDARLELDADGMLVLDYTFDAPIHQIAYTHTVTL